jgi:hypothetical protein
VQLSDERVDGRLLPVAADRTDPATGIDEFSKQHEGQLV